MNDQPLLRNLILTHWQQYHPTMLRQFQMENRLEAELMEATERFTDLLYNLVAVQKMEYHAAWEIVIHELLLPEEEE